MNGYYGSSDREILQADPLELVLMLYERALQNLESCIGMARIEPGRIDNTRNIIRELRSSLDLAQGGEVAHRLLELYRFVEDRLDQASTSGDLGCAVDCLQVLRPLYEGWVEVRKSQVTATVPTTAGVWG